MSINTNVLSLSSIIANEFEVSKETKSFFDKRPPYRGKMIIIHSDRMITVNRIKDNSKFIGSYNEITIKGIGDYELFSYENTLITAKPFVKVNLYDILEYMKVHTNFKKLYIMCDKKEIDYNNYMLFNAKEKEYIGFEQNHIDEDLSFLDNIRIIFPCMLQVFYPFDRNYCEKDIVRLSDSQLKVYAAYTKYYTNTNEMFTWPCVVIQSGDLYFDDEMIKNLINTSIYM